MAAPSRPYVDTSAKALALSLYDRALDPEQFEVFARRALVGARARLDLAIIGASHVVQFETASGVASEILACHPPLDQGPCAHFAPGALPKRVTRQEAAAGSWSLRMTAERLRRPPPPPDWAGTPGAALLEVHFPAQPGRASPLTRIAAVLPEEGPLLARVATLHWYESEGLGVFTETHWHAARAHEPPRGKEEVIPHGS